MKRTHVLDTTVWINHCFDFDLTPYIDGRKVLLLTDTKVETLWQSHILSSFDGCSLFCYPIPQGEQFKCLETISALYSHLLANHFGRDDLIVAFGGGVVGDIGGFVAATYMRGMGYISIPTTLLAQVDSAYGGKCGVNFGGSKNSIGSFYLPKAVFVDTEFLSSLSPVAIKSGLCELIKYGLIYDQSLLNNLEMSVKLMNFTDVIYKAIEDKNHFVSNDILDKGTRAYLNFGHSIGHCIEALSDYAVPHGLAVGAGMVYATKIGIALGVTPPHLLDVIQKILNKYDILYDYVFSYEKIYDIMRTDKKTGDGTIGLVLLEDLQHPTIKKVPFPQLKELLKEVF